LTELKQIKTTLENLAKEQTELNKEISKNYKQKILDDIEQQKKILDILRNSPGEYEI